MTYTPPSVGASSWDVPLNAALAAINTDVVAAQAGVDRLSAGGGAEVATTQTTASTSYTDLATTGPTVAITLASARTVLVFVKAVVFQASTTDDVFMSFTASGATTLAADNNRAMRHNGSGTAEGYSAVAVVACNAGTTTFTARYRVDGGSGSWTARVLAVVPL